MKRRTVAIFVIAASVGVVVLALAPVVSSPLVFTYHDRSGGHMVTYSAYESPSCVLFGIGSTLGVSVNPATYSYNGKPIVVPLGYYLKCPFVNEIVNDLP